MRRLRVEGSRLQVVSVEPSTFNLEPATLTAYLLKGLSSMTYTQPIPLLDLKAQYAPIREEIRAVIDRVADSQYFIGGPEVEGLEQEIAAYSGAQYGVGVTSGTDALIVALMAICVKPGDEVITTPYTFFATGGSIARLGAAPVFVDIDPFSYNIDPALIEAAITERTVAIMPVHLYGQVADMDPIMEIARRRGLYVIEDAAQAIGAEYKGRRAGAIGDFGCFSFFPSKNLGAFGDGGMITANDPELAHRARLLRNHGAEPKYYHKVVGGNFRLDALQAAVLRIKLKYLDGWTAGRQRNAACYRKLFAERNLAAPAGSPAAQDGAVALPVEAAERRHIYNQFVIRTARRDAVMAVLKERKIGHEIYYPVALHRQECFAGLGYAEGSLPVSEAAARETLALPIYPELTEEMQAAVVDAVAAAYDA
jgi:dTDP-4-amino-4,6-dideoxygalactose transaminase